MPIQKPKSLAIIKIPGYSVADKEGEKGNHSANAATQPAALQKEKPGNYSSHHYLQELPKTLRTHLGVLQK